MEDLQNEAQQKNVDTTIDYIEAIKEIKENSVDKETYLKLKEENKKLLNSLVNGETLPAESQEQKVDIDALRQELFGIKHKTLNNLEFVDKALKLRNALIEKGENDSFVATGSKIKPTDEDYAKAEKVAKVLQECVDYADGDPNVFTDELNRKIN